MLLDSDMVYHCKYSKSILNDFNQPLGQLQNIFRMRVLYTIQIITMIIAPLFVYVII